MTVFRLYGMLGSPYTMKMRAILRYRRIEHLRVPAVGGMPPIADIKPPVIPVVEFPDGSFHVDSTPTIDKLEALESARSVVPEDPALAFVAYLLEDFADEWLTKLMFHYRWAYADDAQSFATQGAYELLGSERGDEVAMFAEMFRQRQMGRMDMVGCGEANRGLLEATFEEIARLYDEHLRTDTYLFGSRPSRADFALYGQFSQMVDDPTPAAWLACNTPVFYRWVLMTADLSGLEGTWTDADAPLSPLALGLLRLCDEVYAPFLSANAAALADGSPRLSVELRGQTYEQPPYKYQAKCLRLLREGYGSLDESVRARVDGLLGSLDALLSLLRST